MIEEYFQEKEDQKKKEKLIAWKQFYLENNNGLQAKRVGYKLEKL